MIQNIHARFSKQENQLRLAIMNFIIDNQKPFHLLTDIALLQGLTFENPTQLQDALLKLDRENAFVRDEEDTIHFIYPVSAIPTHHRVTLADGRSFTAMCAIDAIGSTYTFGQDTQIDSVCSGCGTPIHLSMREGKCIAHSPANIQAITFQLDAIANWAGSC